MEIVEGVWRRYFERNEGFGVLRLENRWNLDLSCGAEYLETPEVSLSCCPVQVGREEELDGAGVLARLLVLKHDPPVSEGCLQGSMV